MRRRLRKVNTETGWSKGIRGIDKNGRIAVYKCPWAIRESGSKECRNPQQLSEPRLFDAIFSEVAPTLFSKAALLVVAIRERQAHIEMARAASGPAS